MNRRLASTSLALPALFAWGIQVPSAAGANGAGCIVNSDCTSGLCMQPAPCKCQTGSCLCPTASCLGNTPNVTIQTSKGTFITAVNGGGLGGSDAAMNTNRTQQLGWETFTCILTLPNKLSLKTSGGNWITASLGGGVGGPNADPFEIHTDAKKAGPWEQFKILTSDGASNNCALVTNDGLFITAVNGGGFPGHGFRTTSDPTYKFPIHTDATWPQPALWEMFTINPQ